MSELCERTSGMPYYILGVCDILGGTFVLWQFCRFIKARNKEQSKNKIIYNLSCAFFSMITFALFMIGLGMETWCGGDVRILVNLGQIGYFGQYLLLFGLLFYRLDVIFRDTPLPLSQCTKRAFYGSYAMTIILVVLMVFMSVRGATSSTPAVILLICLFLTILTFIVLLIAPFIYKIRAISKWTGDQSLLSTVVKTFILSFASIISVIIVAITIVLNASAGRTPFSFILEGLLIITDQITNFSSIFLGFRSFEAEYMMACGLCHAACMKCCGGNASFGPKGVKDMEQPSTQEVASQSPAASCSGQDETVTV